MLLRPHQLHTDEYADPLGYRLLADARNLVYGLLDGRRYRLLWPPVRVGVGGAGGVGLLDRRQQLVAVQPGQVRQPLRPVQLRADLILLSILDSGLSLLL